MSAPGPVAPGARPARRAGAARATGLVLAVLLVLVGLVLVREALASASLGLDPSQAWLPDLLRSVDGRPVDSTVALVGGVLALLGILLLVAAWRTGPADVAVRAAPAARLGPEDLARLSSATAEDVDGVLRVSSTATPRSVQVRVLGTGAPGLAEEVRTAVEDRLAGLDPVPRVRVAVRDSGAGR
ncbi:DUF6286 domain-containing protein [Cellulomonas sp. ACRRI]|uniref:DUF6286 domain-containing protein n=1 Tax=Cellulomonas sp. ACRRI TaxID=2918188 RepID=UPI001EF19EB2|nr:DUF6286 domain-containing protein [Cellulomonas sp. ACRRI]MCG7284538.1 DUF6286 domain-containing protein [Cellulomonas sp. ACRRI]